MPDETKEEQIQEAADSTIAASEQRIRENASTIKRLCQELLDSGQEWSPENKDKLKALADLSGAIVEADEEAGNAEAAKNGEGNGGEGGEEVDLESKTIAELKELCEEKSIDTSGFRLKQDYIDALKKEGGGE